MFQLGTAFTYALAVMAFSRIPFLKRARFCPGMPVELVRHFDPRQPLLAGAVGAAEASSGFLRLRLKRHRWFPKTLKTRDPLIFSVGAMHWPL